MRLSEFWTAVTEEFGLQYGRALTHDLVLGELGDLTAEQALERGLNIRATWLALCRATDVPESRWYGAGQKAPKR
ncbi:MAG TPA: DUF3046 domain-containing protein [Lacisediminihabitans sp.]|uniref:DUF3046 domain-containing protein n=1 Tax=Lacisediminihabitans sp. TaxID=2787631 RepID=UPI002ED825B9